jgi:hypothetical protein
VGPGDVDALVVVFVVGGVTVAVTVTDPAVGGVVVEDGACDPVQPPSDAATTTRAAQRAITGRP